MRTVGLTPLFGLLRPVQALVPAVLTCPGRVSAVSSLAPAPPHLPASTPPLVSSFWQPEPEAALTLNAETSLHVEHLLTNADHFSEHCEALARHYSFNVFSIAMFFSHLGQILPTLRPEPIETRLALIDDLLEGARGDTTLLARIASFLVGDDWRRRPIRSSQTLLELLDTALAGTRFYERVRMELPDQPILNAANFVAYIQPFASIPLGETGYQLQAAPGSSEAHGGLTVLIAKDRGEIVAKIGLQLGSETLSVVQLQGGGKHFSTHRDRLRTHIGTLHPFAWFLRNLAQWSSSAGYGILRGYGWRLNSSLQNHFQKGDFPAERAAHLEKIYDGGFRSFGMTQHPDLADVYEIGLADWREHQAVNDSDRWITRLMEAALRG